MSEARVFIIGATGRIGTGVRKICTERGIAVKREADGAEFVVLACPRSATHEWIESNSQPRGKIETRMQEAATRITGIDDVTVIDCSGVLKNEDEATLRRCYGLVGEGGTMPLRGGERPKRSECFANVGCIASSVIIPLLVLRDAKSLSLDHGSRIIATSIASKSSAPRGQERGGEGSEEVTTHVKAGNRLGRTHPHVPEIEFATGGRVIQLAPIICPSVDQGIFTSVTVVRDRADDWSFSSRWSQPGGRHTSSNLPCPVDLHEIIGTPSVIFSSTSSQSDGAISFMSALDNIVMPSTNAVSIIEATVKCPK